MLDAPAVISRRYWLAAAALLSLVAAVAGLMVVGYLDGSRQRRSDSFRALAGAARAAATIRGAGAAEVASALAEEGERELGREGLERLFFLRRGEQVGGLGLARPARIEVDLGNSLAGTDDGERLATLLARLERQYAADPKAVPELRGLSFPVGEARARLLGVWPHMADGRLAGLVGVEVALTARGDSLLPWALAGAGLLLLLFGGALLVTEGAARRRLAFGAAGVVALALAAGALYSHDYRVASDFVAGRDRVVAGFVNRVAQLSPASLEVADRLWRSIFGEEATTLELVSVTGMGGETVLAALEGAEAVTSHALARTVPVLVVAGLLLVLGVLLLPGLARLSWGLVRLPGIYAYVAPAMVGMVLLVLLPFVMGVGLGFFNADYEFVGLENFHDILFPTATSQTNFYFTLAVTVFWTAANVFLHVTIGLALALVLSSDRIRWRALFRVLLVVPWAIPNYVTALVWKWMFTSQIGAINLMLEAVGLEPVNWFGPSFWTNFFAVLATNTWLGFPFMMVVSLGALQSIPAEMYEAADMDGATRWQKFRFVTLPLLKPALFPAIILGTIWTFNQFNIIFLVTRGQPDNQTNILITEAYRFFAELNQYGVAAAYCVLIFLILLCYTLITNRVSKATQGAFE